MRALVIATLALVACGGRATHEPTSRTTVTSAEARGEQTSIQERIATAICVHEVECGRTRGQPEACIDSARSRTGIELGGWTCDPAAARASAEQCLAAVRGQSCSVDLSSRENVCPLNGGCASVETTPQGPSAADVWRR